MTTKRLPWKPEYATNSELFWHDLDKFNKQYELENQQEEETIVEEPLIDEPVKVEKPVITKEERHQYMKSLLGVK